MRGKRARYILGLLRDGDPQTIQAVSLAMKSNKTLGTGTRVSHKRAYRIAKRLWAAGKLKGRRR